MFRSIILVWLAPAVLCQGGLVVNPKNADNQESNLINAMPIDISELANNRAFGMFPNDPSFDALHSGYPAQYLPGSNLTYSGINYVFPQYRSSGNDNVLAQGQMLNVPRGRYSSIHMLAAAETAVATGTINVTYSDNSTSSGQILVDPFWAWPYPYGGDIIFPFYLTNTSIDYNRSMIFQTSNWLDATKDITALQLPNVTSGSGSGVGGAAEETRLHIFAVSVVPATDDTGIVLGVQLARTTNMWLEGTNKTQIVEVTVNNAGSRWVLANNTVRVTVSAAGLKTVKPAKINRLRPGDRAVVQVCVVNTNGTAAGTSGEAIVHISGTGVHLISKFNATFGVPSYEAEFDSIYSHESPPWYSGGKFGIFIHWGVYSVPGWGNVGDNEQYAEWYWWYMNQGRNGSKGDFWQYHLDTYGPDIVYDDFIQNFTTANYNPREWVDLFADAGARYFVLTSKHHEGYALFDIPSNITERTSVAQFPHKNLVQMLFDAADTYQPSLHKATYFSTPEWFHPDYKTYGFGDWPGGNATNPYTNRTLPYTGYVPVDDYVSDLMLPEMQILADMGTEIMWCDIGGPNLTAQFAARYFNDMAQKGKQVAINNRCGLPGDFDTPEYASYAAVQPRKWESNLGMDPFSYGYNRATPSPAYLSPAAIVTSLVDIVSKNGNFLLDIGPRADGTIVETEKENLLAAGAWIKSHAEAIFNTTYWFVTPSEGENVRFMQTLDAFYVLVLTRPNGTLRLDSPVPYVEGDRVRVVGGNMSGSVVESRRLANGSLLLQISEAVSEADQWCWVFKIPLIGDRENGTATTTEAPAPQQTTSQANRAMLGSLAVLVIQALVMALFV